MKKLTDLRPCDNCNGQLTGGIFYVLRFSLALVRERAVNEFMGMHQFFGGRASVALIENFAPSAANAVVVAMDDPEYDVLANEIVICNGCYMKPIVLAELAEKRAGK
jgi:DNA topoisomerase IB